MFYFPEFLAEPFIGVPFEAFWILVTILTFWGFLTGFTGQHLLTIVWVSTDFILLIRFMSND